MRQAKTVLWRKTDNTSIEYATMYCGDDCFVLEGTILLVLEQLPTKVAYRVECDIQWRTRHVEVFEEQGGKTNRIVLDVDQTQRWQQNRSDLPFAEGLFDVDFEVSPVTNALPINRLDLKIGESAETDAIWVRFPSLRLERLRQKYTRVGDRCYRYQAPDLAFEAQLEVDGDGLIAKYDDLWMRIA